MKNENLVLHYKLKMKNLQRTNGGSAVDFKPRSTMIGGEIFDALEQYEASDLNKVTTPDKKETEFLKPDYTKNYSYLQRVLDKHMPAKKK